ncbi:hypothetical protein Bamb_0011 [Burkholderia ambifaria AMMD]|uniref:Uncharacterized protein n=1 Tax=Burkholderia ambifaria (strain ATCC BAA-244 / DSM 16087 / CCUG 44356 / LMG 19182 / AMMD) TaxID=339670 RepID=Q0BJV1_BURCM|nr:hypothetical protein Bamb_0011 [Burkholderia ambifaria AMMD]
MRAHHSQSRRLRDRPNDLRLCDARIEEANRIEQDQHARQTPSNHVDQAFARMSTEGDLLRYAITHRTVLQLLHRRTQAPDALAQPPVVADLNTHAVGVNHTALPVNPDRQCHADNSSHRECRRFYRHDRPHIDRRHHSPPIWLSACCR